MPQGVQQHKAKGLQPPGGRPPPAPGQGGLAPAAPAAPKPVPAPARPAQAPAKPAGEQRLDPLGRPAQIDPEHQVPACYPLVGSRVCLYLGAGLGYMRLDSVERPSQSTRASECLTSDSLRISKHIGLA